jgi:hypothetical protein
MRIHYKLLTSLLAVLITALTADAFDFRLRTIDANDSIPVTDSRLSLFANDTVKIASEKANLYGIIEIHDIPEGEYLLRIDSEDHIPFSALLSLAKDVNLGDIPLHTAFEDSSSVTLQDLVVEGARITSDAEGLTVIPQTQLARRSTSVLDLLRNLTLPGLIADPVLKTVSVRNGVPLIKVNGVRRSITYLEGISPDMIASIKYSDFPTARYMDEGVSGVIEITLKEPQDGGSVYAYVQGCPYTGFINSAVNSTYNYKDSEFGISVSDSWRKYNDRTLDSTTLWRAPDDSWQRLEKETAKSPFWYNDLNFNANYTYNNGRGFSLNTSFSGNIFRNRSHTDALYTVNDSKELDRHTEVDRRSFTPTLDIYMQREWKDGRVLEANLVGSMDNSKSRSLFLEENPDTSETRINNGNDGRSQGVIGEVQWTQPIRSISWRFGLKEEFNHARNKYLVGAVDHLNQSRTYFNTNISGAASQFSYYVGGGISYRKAKAGDIKDRSWQPSGMISLRQNFQHASINFIARYSPSFPSLAQLSQVKQESNTIVTVTGNPDLRTSHSWSVMFAGYYNLNKFWINPHIRNQHINNLIISDYQYMGDGKFLSYQKNFSHYNMFDIGTQISLRELFGHITVSANVSWSHYRLSNGSFHDTLGFIDYGIYLSGWYRNFSLSAYYARPSKSLSGYNVVTGENSSNVTLAYRYRDFQFTAGVYFLGYARGAVYRNESRNPLVSSSSLTQIGSNANMLVLGVTYNMRYKRQYRNTNRGLQNQVVDQSVLSPL